MIPVRVTLSSISQLFAAKILTINSAIKMTNAKKSVVLNKLCISFG